MGSGRAYLFCRGHLQPSAGRKIASDSGTAQAKALWAHDSPGGGGAGVGSGRQGPGAGGMGARDRKAFKVCVHVYVWGGAFVTCMQVASLPSGDQSHTRD